MADADLRSAAVQDRAIRTTDLVFGADPTETDAALAARMDTLAQLIATIFQNPPSSLTAAQQAALRTLIGVLTQAEVDARAVARYTNAEKTKLAGVEGSATADQTGAEIVALLAALTGNARLNAASLRLIAAAIDAELGNATWRTGGSGGFTLRTGAGAPANSLGDNGDWYLRTSNGQWYEKASGAWASRYTDQVGQMGGGLTEAQVDARIANARRYYQIDSTNVTGTANDIVLTTGAGLSSLTGGELFFFSSEGANTGAVTVNVDSVGAVAVRVAGVRDNGDVGSEALVGGEITNNDPIMLVYGSQFNEFYLLPARAGTATAYNVGTSARNLAALGAGGVFAAARMPTLRSQSTTELASPADADRIFLSDESASGDPNRYLTLTGLFGLLRDLTATNVALLSDDDRFFFSDESAPGGPLRYITRAQLQSEIGGGGGFTLRTGSTAPDNSLGDNGDWYLRTSNGQWYEKAAGAWASRYTDQVGQAGSGQTEAQVNTQIQTALAAAVSGNTETGINVTYNSDGTLDFVVGADQAHDLIVGWSPDTAISDAELAAGNSPVAGGANNEVTIPGGAGNQYLFIWRADADGGDPSEVHIAGGGNQRNIFGAATARTYNGNAGQLIVSVTTQNVFLLSEETVRIV